MPIHHLFYHYVKIIVVWAYLTPFLRLAMSKQDFVIESDHFGNNVCFVNVNFFSTIVLHDDLKQSCCFNFLEHGRGEEEEAVIERIDDFFDSCVEGITKVPIIDVVYDYVPVYYLHKERVNEGLSGGDHSHQPMLNSPFHHPSIMELTNDMNISEEDHAVEYQIGHDTTLLDEGGMHRAFINRVTIALDPKQHFTKRSLIPKDVQTLTLKGNMTFLFPILKGYFIDLDDPFQDDIDQACHLQQSLSTKDSCHVKIVTTPSDLVIDIEQPSFASKQHVIAFRLHFQASIMNDFSSHGSDPLIELTFVPMIHLRYQPIVKKYDYRKGLILIPVSNLFLHHANIETKVTNSNNANNYTYHTNFKIAQQVEKSNQSRILSVEVATGLDSHHDIVMIFTMLACFLGAIQMIRDFSKIGQWY